MKIAGDLTHSTLVQTNSDEFSLPVIAFFVGNVVTFRVVRVALNVP
jgi:hypothetical protein